MIAEQRKTVYEKSFGFKDPKSSDLVNNCSHFAIASITKMVTSIIVLQLVEEEKLKTEDRVSKLLTELIIPKGDKITIHHLLLHISGLPNEPEETHVHFISRLQLPIDPIAATNHGKTRRNSWRELRPYTNSRFE
ncbi:MAG: D-alanyl-D-alanine carboxypeptidase [Cryomorphaceae bacterium]